MNHNKINGLLKKTFERLKRSLSLKVTSKIAKIKNVGVYNYKGNQISTESDDI